MGLKEAGVEDVAELETEYWSPAAPPINFWSQEFSRFPTRIRSTLEYSVPKSSIGRDIRLWRGP
jgi:hypothetical protein